MRVALVIDLGITDQESRTATRNWAPVISALNNEQINGRLITSGSSGELHRLAQELGWPAVGLGGTRSSMGIRIGRLSRFLSRHETDLIHAHEVVPAITAGAAGAFGAKVPIVFHRHHLYSSKRHAFASRIAARSSTATFAVSHAVAGAATRDDRSRESEVLVTWNGTQRLRPVSQEEVERNRSSLGIARDEPVACFVGRMRKEKAIHIAIEAAGLASTTVPELNLVLVGAGPEEEALRAQAATSPPGLRVHFVGHQDDIAPWLALSDFVVFPSLREAFPLVVLEAMAAGRPVIASAVGGITEILSERNGVLVPTGDVVALARAIIRLAVNHEVRDALGLQAVKTFEGGFTIEAMVRRWVNGYERVLTASKY